MEQVQNPRPSVSEVLMDLEACSKAVKWSREYGSDYAAAWNDCKRSDWMIWIAIRLGIHKKMVISAMRRCLVMMRKNGGLGGEWRYAFDSILNKIDFWLWYDADPFKDLSATEYTVNLGDLELSRAILAAHRTLMVINYYDHDHPGSTTSKHTCHFATEAIICIAKGIAHLEKLYDFDTTSMRSLEDLAPHIRMQIDAHTIVQAVQGTPPQEGSGAKILT